MLIGTLKRFGIGALSVMVVVLVCAETTMAQERGFRFGSRVRLFPKVRLLGGFNSNPLFLDSAASGDFVLRAIPSLNIDLGGNRLKGNIGYSFKHASFVDTPIQDTNDHSLDAEITYKAPRWNMSLTNDLSITSDPAGQELTQRIQRTENLSKLAGRYFSPARDLEFRLEYSYKITDFDDPLNTFNSLQNLLVLSSKVNASSFFRFLPKTSANFSFEYGHADYPNASPTERSAADSFTTQIGLTGRVTHRLSVTASVGFSVLDFDVGNGNETFVARLVGEFHKNNKRFVLGFERLARVAYFSNYYEALLFLYKFEWRSYSKRFSLKFSGDINFVGFSGPTGVQTVPGNPNSLEARNDFIVRNNLELVYHFRKHINFLMRYTMLMRDTNAVSLTTGLNSSDFLQHETLLGVEFYY